MSRIGDTKETDHVFRRKPCVVVRKAYRNRQNHEL